MTFCQNSKTSPIHLNQQKTKYQLKYITLLKQLVNQYLRSRHSSPDLLKIARQEFEFLISQGIIRMAIMADALDSAIGSVLHTTTSNGQQPLAFYCRKLTPSERKYNHQLLTFAFTKKSHSSSPRQPSKSNGIVEQFHQSLKQSLKCHASTKWTKSIPLDLLELQTALKDLQCTSAKLVYGSTLRLPAEFFKPLHLTSSLMSF
ncbi:retrovirus-related Pol polyprotein from transposon 17.6 [Trichonephila clavipes]|nr:retrovirus-related Pol polyprotein from transposon 17.6 [Trichonephila clavipes]